MGFGIYYFIFKLNFLGFLCLFSKKIYRFMGSLEIGLFTRFMGLKGCPRVNLGLVCAQPVTDLTKLSGGSSNLSPTGEGVRLERTDSCQKVVSSVQIIHGGKIRPK